MDAVERDSEVVFGAGVEIFEAELVFDGDDEASVGGEETGGLGEAVADRIWGGRKDGCIFEDADEEDPVVGGGGGEVGDVVEVDGNIGEVAAAGGGDLGAGGTAFNGMYGGTAFAEIAGEGAAAAAEFEDAVAGTDGEGTKEKVAGAGKVVLGGPVGNGGGEFGGKYGEVAGVADDVEDAGFGPIGIGDGGSAGAFPNKGCGIALIGGAHDGRSKPIPERRSSR